MNAYSKRYPKFAIHYAVKANNNPAITSILVDEGAGVDCSCSEEIAIAKKIEVSTEKILYS